MGMKKILLTVLILFVAVAPARAELILEWGPYMPDRILSDAGRVTVRGILTNSILSSEDLAIDVSGWGYGTQPPEGFPEGSLKLVSHVDWGGSAVELRPGESRIFEYASLEATNGDLPLGTYSGYMKLTLYRYLGAPGTILGPATPRYRLATDYAVEVVESLVVPPEAPTTPNIPSAPTAPNAPTSPTTPTAPQTPKSPAGPVSPTPPNLNTLFTAFAADDNGSAPVAYLESQDVQTTTNPEPMTLLLFGGGMAGALMRRRRNHKTREAL